MPARRGDYPKYADMVVEAIVTLQQRSGSSLIAIKKFIGEKWNLPDGWEGRVGLSVKKMVQEESLTKLKASFKLGDELKKSVKKERKATAGAKPKPVAKPAPKKAPAAKAKKEAAPKTQSKTTAAKAKAKPVKAAKATTTTRAKKAVSTPPKRTTVKAVIGKRKVPTRAAKGKSPVARVTRGRTASGAATKGGRKKK